jgi:hypothetical protein
MQDPMRWYKEARKLIPQLPQLSPMAFVCQTGSKDHWYLETTPEISVKYLKFTLINGKSERCHLVIDRTVNGM